MKGRSYRAKRQAEVGVESSLAIALAPPIAPLPGGVAVAWGVVGAVKHRGPSYEEYDANSHYRETRKYKEGRSVALLSRARSYSSYFAISTTHSLRSTTPAFCLLIKRGGAASLRSPPSRPSAPARFGIGLQIGHR